VSKTDFSDAFLVARKTQQVTSWSRDGMSHGARCARNSSGHAF